MTTPRLPSPFGTSWALWGESLIRVLQPWILSTQDFLAKISFLSLSDAPKSYTGQAGKVVAVNATETGLEFVSGGGGGGQATIQFQDEGVNLGTTGTVTLLNFTGAGVTASRTGNDVTVNVPGGGGLSGTVTATVPANSFQHEEAFAAVGVTPSSRIFLSLGTMLDSDENAADMLDIAAMGARPGTGTLTLLMSFSTKTSGPIPVNWSAL